MIQAGERTSPRGSNTAKAVQAILKALDELNPPIRLLVDCDAVRLAIATDEAKLTETRAWQQVSISTEIEKQEAQPRV
jgi:hypothetical protein